MNNYNIHSVSRINNLIYTNYIIPSDNIIFKSGKHSGKTFKHVYDKYPEYVYFISTHKYLKNPIFSSFKEYTLSQ